MQFLFFCLRWLKSHHFEVRERKRLIERRKKTSKDMVQWKNCVEFVLNHFIFMLLLRALVELIPVKITILISYCELLFEYNWLLYCTVLYGSVSFIPSSSTIEGTMTTMPHYSWAEKKIVSAENRCMFSVCCTFVVKIDEFDTRCAASLVIPLKIQWVACFYRVVVVSLSLSLSAARLLFAKFLPA